MDKKWVTRKEEEDYVHAEIAEAKRMADGPVRAFSITYAISLLGAIPERGDK
jgi:hypothetical protein